MNTSDSEPLDQQHQSSFPDYQHLNMDLCMELICPYFEVNDLSRVADSCKQMKRAAELAFADKYLKQSFFIRIKRKGLFNCDWTDESKISLSDPNTYFKVLRCFGHMISKLCLQYDWSTNPFWTYVDEYIAKYCANHLTELQLWDRATNFGNLETVFPNVEEISFINCELSKAITEFNKRFPKMRIVEFATTYRAGTVVADQRCIVDHFPNLTHLSIHIFYPRAHANTEFGFREETVLNCLELNPKLQRLNLFLQKHLSSEFVKEISEKCESLEALQIVGYPLEFHDMVHFKNLKYFNYEHCCSTFSTPIPLTFGALESFECPSLTTLQIILDFVRKNPSIKILKLSLFSACLTNGKIIEMRNTFAFTTEIELDVSVCGNLSEGILSSLLNGLSSLQKLILRPSYQCSFSDLVKLVRRLPHTSWTIDKKNKTMTYHKTDVKDSTHGEFSGAKRFKLFS